MKKNFLTRVMMMAMTIVCLTTFTAWGGDDGNDPTPIPTPGTGGTSGVPTTGSEIQYFIPCLDWNAGQDGVKAFMAKEEEWTLELSSSSSMTYQHVETGRVVTYYVGNKLSRVVVMYDTSWDGAFAYMRSETEKLFGVKLTSVVEGMDAMYSGKTTLNGQERTIIVTNMGNNNVSVTF